MAGTTRRARERTQAGNQPTRKQFKRKAQPMNKTSIEWTHRPETRGEAGGMTWKPREHRDPRFKDPRSRVLWRSGRVILKGADMTALRWTVYHRASGRCEVKANGRRCNKFAPFDGYGHGELAHVQGRGRTGSDTPENTLWSCRSCHREGLHVGPQFAPQRRRRAETGANPEGPGEPVHGGSDGR